MHLSNTAPDIGRQQIEIDRMLRHHLFDELFGHGRHRVGDRELRTLDQEATRAMLSVVPQDVHLFNATIEDNLLVADANAERDDLDERVEGRVVVAVAGEGEDGDADTHDPFARDQARAKEDALVGAAAVAFLCTPEAAYIRGQSLAVDGGRTRSI